MQLDIACMRFRFALGIGDLIINQEYKVGWHMKGKSLETNTLGQIFFLLLIQPLNLWHWDEFKSPYRRKSSFYLAVIVHSTLCCIFHREVCMENASYFWIRDS